MRKKFRRQIIAFFLALCVFSLPLADYRAKAFFFGGVSLKDEKQMGQKFDTALRSHMGLVEDPEVKQYVADLLARLVKAMPKQPFEFHSSVIHHNSLNAFAVPGGYVYIFTGLLMNLNNEAELAGVMAHELAHVTQRHVASRMERAQYLSLGALLAGIAGIAIGGPAGAAAAISAAGASQSAMLNYSRIDESEADNLGLQYIAAAGYPPDGMVGGFKVLRQKSWLSGINVPTYLSTHPAIGDRINNLDARIKAMPGAKERLNYDNSRFRRVQTLLWGRYGDTQAALQKFSGKDALSLLGKGMVLSRLNRIPQATEAYDAALAKAPHDPLILREAGIFHYRKGDLEKAGALLREAMQRDRKDYMAMFFYGRYLDDTGRAKEGNNYYKEVLRYIPEDAEVHEALAKSAGKANNQLLAYIHMTYSAIYSNNKKMAERYFQKAKELAEKSADKAGFKRLETAYRERKELWNKT